VILNLRKRKVSSGLAQRDRLIKLLLIGEVAPVSQKQVNRSDE
jgi:hypothetical protein